MKPVTRLLLYSVCVVTIIALPARAEKAHAPYDDFQWDDGVLRREAWEPIPVVIKQKAIQSYGNGTCVPYARERSGLQLFGRADSFLDQAADAGYSTTTTPMVGSIVVLDEGYAGHVAVVEEILGDSVRISEQNYKGLYIVSERTISVSYERIRGYIYL